MNYKLTHDTVKRDRYNRPRIIAHWDRLGDYLEDVQAVYPTLGGLEHSPPEIKELLLPDPKITEKLERFRTVLDRTELVKSTKLDLSVSDGTLDVGLYLSGVPECFVRLTKVHGTDIRIVFSPEVHYSSNPDALYLRGAAILSLMDSLESSGHRVELYMGWDNTVGSKVYESRILVKRTCDYSTAAQLAGVACDSRFLSTCEYNMIAHFLKTQSVGHNAGFSMPGDVVISGDYKDMAHFDSVKSTLKWIDGMKEKLASRSGNLQ